MKKRLIYAGIALMLAFLFVWQCAPEKKATALSSDVRDEIAMLPQPAMAITYWNIKAIKDSPFYTLVTDSLKKHPFEDEEYKDFVDATGFDVRKDVDAVLVALESAESEKDFKALVIARGTYDPERLVDYAKEKNEKHDIISEEYDGVKLYGEEGKNFRFAFPDNNTAVAGQTALVKAWLDNHKAGKKDMAANKALMDQVEKLKYKDQAWFVMDPRQFTGRIMDEIRKHEGSDARLEVLKTIQSAGFSMQFGNELSFQGVGEFSDAQNAKLFYDVLKGGIAAMKLSMSNDRDAVDVLNKIDASNNEKQVVLDFNLSKADVEKLIAKKRSIAMK